MTVPLNVIPLPNQTSPETYELRSVKKKPSFFSSTHRQMVQFQDIRNALETFLKVSNLLKGVTQFDDWSLVEQSVRVHDEFAMFEGVQVGGDE
jgi:hypothetical protein